MTRRYAPLLIAVFVAISLAMTSGCAGRRFTLKPYKLNIQQGNYLEADDIERVNEGMTRSQVRFLLGTPMIADAFNEHRWDYVFYLKLGSSGDVVQSRMTVFFEGDTVSKVERPDEARITEQIDAAFDS
jgi:outer membrane protein assembly factor BamE